MLRLSGARRLKAAWIVTLAYMLCVLAPTISFAIPGGKAIAYCLTDDDHMPGMIHMHHEGAMRHTQNGGHHHAGMQPHEHASGHHRAMLTAANDDSAPPTAAHDGQCCGLMCVTALPAVLADIIRPSILPSRTTAKCAERVAEDLPRGLYRPPIS